MEIVPVENVNDVEDRQEIEFFNKDNVKSVYNMVPNKIRTILERDGIKEYLSLEEWELRKDLKLTPTLNRLRYAFWNEYYRCVDTRDKRMLQKNIFRGICTSEVYNKMLRSDLNVAWMLCPPTDTILALKETLNYGLDRIREIIDLPLYKTESVKTGADSFEDRQVVDEKVANLMLKAVAMVDLRLHGSYVQVQKIEQKTVNINKNVNVDSANYVDIIPETDIDAQLAQLRNEVKRDVRQLESPITPDELVMVDRAGIDIRDLPRTNAKQVDILLSTELDIDLEDL